MSAQYDRDADDRLDEIKALLTERLEELAEDHLGAPNTGTRHRPEWLWGKKGSRKLRMRGSGRGAYYNHEAAAGGGPLDLIMDARSCGIAEAVRFAKEWLGLGASGPRDPELVEHLRRGREAKRAAGIAAEIVAQNSRVQRAQDLAAASVPPAGTPAERYLTEVRSIPCPANGWPETVRYHHGQNALVVIATNDAGVIRAVQFVYLTADARKISKEEAEQRNLPGPKQTFGVAKGAAVRLPGTNLTLQLNEGPETGLTAWAATGRETWVALGSVGGIEPSPGQRILVCADDDAPHSNSTKSRNLAIAQWRAAGHAVIVAMPWDKRRHDGGDFNTLAQESGIAAVRDRLETAIEPPRPPHADRVSAVKARMTLKVAVNRFFDEARRFLASDQVLDGTTPIVHAIRGAVGLGKSDRMRKAIARLLAEMRARGDLRTIVVAGPTHKLNREQIQKFMNLPKAQEAGLVAGLWIGRTHRDPITGQPVMCRDIEAVNDAQSLGLPVEESACRRRMRAPKGSGQKTQEYLCKHYAACPFQQQKQRRADLWFVPHEMIFSEMPASLGDVALLEPPRVRRRLVSLSQAASATFCWAA